MNDKYVVFKRSEFADLLSSLELSWSEADEIKKAMIQDAVVIRKQDKFAPSALNAYADSILVALEITGAFGVLDPQNEERLIELSGFFRDSADESREMNRKFPD